MLCGDWKQHDQPMIFMYMGMYVFNCKGIYFGFFHLLVHCKTITFIKKIVIDICVFP
jgi:hypothetical protein